MELLGELAELKRIVAEQRDEIARLKGLKSRPTSSQAAWTNATTPKPRRNGQNIATRQGPTPRVALESEVLRVDVPAGSQFKGYDTFVVQDLVLRAQVIRYRRERWVTPDGREGGGAAAGGHRRPFWAGVAPLRADAASPGSGNGGAAQRAAARGGSQHLQAPSDAAADRSPGRFSGRKSRDVLRAGLQTASWITVDDTGARHAGRNGFCTHMWTAPSLARFFTVREFRSLAFICTAC